jgi:hypothetical protein
MGFQEGFILLKNNQLEFKTFGYRNNDKIINNYITIGK